MLPYSSTMIPTLPSLYLPTWMTSILMVMILMWFHRLLITYAPNLTTARWVISDFSSAWKFSAHLPASHSTKLVMHLTSSKTSTWSPANRALHPWVRLLGSPVWMVTHYLIHILNKVWLVVYSTSPLSRPDIAYVVNQVCQFIHAPRTIHLQTVKRIFRYIKGTLGHGLLFHKSS